MRIGFIGTGKMGTPMALRLLAAGHELAVWNRSEGRTEPLLREGAIAAGTPAEAELGADVVITMLFDDAAHEEVLFGAHRLIDALSPGALHISCSTISVAPARLTGRAAIHLGRVHAAERNRFHSSDRLGQNRPARRGERLRIFRRSEVRLLCGGGVWPKGPDVGSQKPDQGQASRGQG